MVRTSIFTYLQRKYVNSKVTYWKIMSCCQIQNCPRKSTFRNLRVRKIFYMMLVPSICTAFSLCFKSWVFELTLTLKLIPPCKFKFHLKTTRVRWTFALASAVKAWNGAIADIARNIQYLVFYVFSSISLWYLEQLCGTDSEFCPPTPKRKGDAWVRVESEEITQLTLENLQTHDDQNNANMFGVFTAAVTFTFFAYVAGLIVTLRLNFGFGRFLDSTKIISCILSKSFLSVY